MRYAAITIILLSSPITSNQALAEDCASGLKVEQGAIGKIISCMQALQVENVELRNQLDEIKGRTSAPGLEGKQGAKGDRGEKGDPGSSAEVPIGAVVAFNRSESGITGDRGACPIGWKLFREAGGRVIIGAGQHANAHVSVYPSFTDNPVNAVGGQEEAIIIGQQPTVITAPKSSGFLKKNSREYDAIPDLSYYSPSTPDYNISTMQPYIALYYCSKDR